MIRRLLRLFPYVQGLEARLRELEEERTSERNIVVSMNRYIDQLEALKKHQDETVSALRDEKGKTEDKLEAAYASCARLTVEVGSLQKRLKTAGEKP